MARKKWPKKLVQQIWDSSGGVCHHCGCRLQPEVDGRRAWHLDHFPVPYRDIENNACAPCISVCGGVSDPMDPRNLVASCPTCNLSHAHESTACCGHAQLYCSCTLAWKVCWAAATTTLIIATVAVTRYFC